MYNDLKFKDIPIRSFNKEIANKLAIIARNKSICRSDLLKQEISKIIESEKNNIDLNRAKEVSVTRVYLHSVNTNTLNKLTTIANHYGLSIPEYLKLKFAEIANNASPFELRNTDLEKE